MVWICTLHARAELTLLDEDSMRLDEDDKRTTNERAGLRNVRSIHCPCGKVVHVPK